MKFAEMIKSNSWLSVELVFLQLFPDEQNQIAEYEKMFKDLLLLTPLETDISIVVSNEKDDFDNSEYVQVYGYYNDPKKSENEITSGLAIEYTPWQEWLGMGIDKETLLNFTEPEIVSHCIHEMTYAGFDQDEIKEGMDKLKAMSEEIKNMTEEEKKENLIPWEDVKKKFNNGNE